MFQLDTQITPTGFPPVAETLPGVVENLVLALRPEKIILFGSYAYGQPTADSDVDLLIIWNAPASRRERIAQVSRVLSPRFFPVDIISKTAEEIARESPVNFFLREILTKGKILYERR